MPCGYPRGLQFECQLWCEPVRHQCCICMLDLNPDPSFNSPPGRLFAFFVPGLLCQAARLGCCFLMVPGDIGQYDLQTSSETGITLLIHERVFPNDLHWLEQQTHSCLQCAFIPIRAIHVHEKTTGCTWAATPAWLRKRACLASALCWRDTTFNCSDRRVHRICCE